MDSLSPPRYIVLAVFALAALMALGSWLVRARYVSPFSGVGRAIRSSTDWIIKPVERRLVRMGGNPVNAGWWLVIVVAIAGVVALSLLGWLQGFVANLRWAAAGGTRQFLATLVTIVHSIIFFALIVRIVASWLGWFRYTRWMRPFYVLTDWVVEPLRRVLPTFGPWDFSPLAAILVLLLLKRLLLLSLGF